MGGAERAGLDGDLVADALAQAMRSCLLSPQGRIVSVDRESDAGRLRFEFDATTWALVNVLVAAEETPRE